MNSNVSETLKIYAFILISPRSYDRTNRNYNLIFTEFNDTFYLYDVISSTVAHTA
jgi:hypothetical protein